MNPDTSEVVGDLGTATMETLPTRNFLPEPRCHVCRDESICQEVNRLLMIGAGYALIARSVRAGASDDHGGGPVLSVDSVRNHCHRHFPVQQGARAAYREILERRARESSVGFEDGVALAITPLAYYETVVARSYQALVESAAPVDLRMGIAAADRLQSALAADGGSADIAGAYVKLDNLIRAVKQVVPESMWPEIAASIDSA